MANRCSICSNRALLVDESYEVIDCNVCGKLFHSECVNMRENDVVYMRNNNTPYLCTGCSKKNNSDEVLA